MLEYGRVGHGRFRAGLGDWSENIKSGRVQPAAPLPPADEVPAPLRAVCRTWGYLPPEGDDAPDGPGARAARNAPTVL